MPGFSLVREYGPDLVSVEFTSTASAVRRFDYCALVLSSKDYCLLKINISRLKPYCHSSYLLNLFTILDFLLSFFPRQSYLTVPGRYKAIQEQGRAPSVASVELGLKLSCKLSPCSIFQPSLSTTMVDCASVTRKELTQVQVQSRLWPKERQIWQRLKCKVSKRAQEMRMMQLPASRTYELPPFLCSKYELEPSVAVGEIAQRPQIIIVHTKM